MKMMQQKIKFNYSGYIGAVILIACVLTACQPTPENLVVQNKGDDDLQQAIVQTASPVLSSTNVIESATQTPQPNEPIAHIEDISSNASKTVTVDIHAEVINNQPDNIPVAKIHTYAYKKDEILHMIEVFFGNTELYTREMTKEDYDYYILQKQYQMNDPEQLQAYADIRDITDLEVAKVNIQAVIDRAIENRKNAPNEREIIDYDIARNSDRNFDVYVKTRDGFLGRVQHNCTMSAFNDDDNYYMSRNLDDFECIESECSEEEFLNAKQMAIDLVSDMGIDNVIFGDAYLAKDIFFTDNGPYWNGREHYVFCFNTVIGDSMLEDARTFTIPPALVDMSGKDGYEDVSSVQYAKVIPYDRLEVWVEGDKVVQFKHRYPIEVCEIINDNVDIAIDYPQAIELAKQFAYTAFIDPRGSFVESKIDINKIELVLVRIKEKDTGDDIVVPVWNFCGAWLFKQNPDNEYKDPTEDENGWSHREGREEFDDVLITINALDGTVVDLFNGY